MFSLPNHAFQNFQFIITYHKLRKNAGPYWATFEGAILAGFTLYQSRQLKKWFNYLNKYDGLLHPISYVP